MIRKLTFFCLFLLLTSSAIFAQQKTAKFLGTWKLAESGNKWADKFGIESMTITVTEADNNLVIEKNSQRADNATSHKIAYKTTGATTIKLIGGRFGGAETRYLQFLKDNKMQLVTTVQKDYDTKFVLGATPGKETWTLSDDGKTLTVKSVNRYSSAKMVFTKE